MNEPDQRGEVEPGLYVVVDPTGRLAHDLHELIARIGGVHAPPEPAEDPPDPPRRPSRLERLTRREVEVLRLVGQRRSNSEIARLLWISQDTVRFHLRNAYRKLAVHNRRDALAAAERRGLLRSRDRDG